MELSSAALLEHGVERPEDWLGQVLVVPDRQWGFQAVGRDGHPGACLAPASDGQRDLPLLKGTSARATSPWPDDFEVQADRENGLAHATWFKLYPRFLPRRRVELMLGERRLGRLAEADRVRLLAELRRVLEPQQPQQPGEPGEPGEPGP